MRLVLASYALESLEAFPVDVIVAGDRAKVVGSDTDRCLLSVRRPAPGGEGSGRGPLRNLAPERLSAGKVSSLLPFYRFCPSYEIDGLKYDNIMSSESNL
jgi:hypothetical protein